ncbi:MAG TPA: Uma2 family endonuclease [Thermoanaerobaculia bacterium]|nr:Uma2 family endonuclease [Thermoanaerobaculia bacterium]
MTANFEIHHWTGDEYDQMVEAGLFGDRGVELVDGVVYDMTPQSRRHAAALRKARRVLESICPDGCEVEVQMPMSLDPDSTPEPDLAIVPRDPGDYAGGHPTTALLVVEVADSSLRHDRNQKARAYARAGIQDFWILNLLDNLLEVYRDPAEGAYRNRQILRRGERIGALARPDLGIAVENLLPAKL